MNRVPWSRAGAALAATALAGSLLIASAGSGLAANTRDIYFGSPPPAGTTDPLATCDPVTGYCPLSFTPVTAGGLTAVDVVVINLGGQTVNHVAILGGVEAQASYNDLFPLPSGDSLPGPHGSSSFAATYPASACQISSLVYPDGSGPYGNDSLDCPIGQLAAMTTSGTIRIIIRVPTTPGAYTVWLAADLNEGTSSSGSNQDTFYATGTLSVAAPSCDSASGYFLDSQSVSLSNQAGVQTPCTQATGLRSLDLVGGDGTFASVSIAAPRPCPSNLRCFGQESVASVLGGLPVPGGLEWTITWSQSLLPNGKPKGVIHEHLDYDPTDPSTYDLIPFTGKYQCSTSLATNCWSFAGPVAGGYQAVFVTPDNGSGRGY